MFINRYRKERRVPRHTSIDDLEPRFQAALADPNTVELLSGPPALRAEMSRQVSGALDQLPDPFRSVVLLVDVEELSYEEAAAALQCPVGTVRSRLSRARKLLFVALHGYAVREGYPGTGSGGGAC